MNNTSWLHIASVILLLFSGYLSGDVSQRFDNNNVADFQAFLAVFLHHVQSMNFTTLRSMFLLRGMWWLTLQVWFLPQR